MRVFQFTEQPYSGLDRTTTARCASTCPIASMRSQDRRRSAFIAITTSGSSPTSSASTSCSTSTTDGDLHVVDGDRGLVGAGARITKRARLLVLGYPIGAPARSAARAEELATIDVISRGRLDMGFVKGVPYRVPVSNQNPVGVMERFWEAHDFIIKAMTSHDEPFNWESENFHYRQVNIWPRP